MARLVFEARVACDLAEIQRFIGRDSPVDAERFIVRLEGQCRKIAMAPFLGRARDELGPGIRSLPFGRYVILYRASRDEVLVVAVIHGARDVARALAEPLETREQD